jgi:peptidoglycan/LPS O-acetylase OafA/YrhL
MGEFPDARVGRIAEPGGAMTRRAANGLRDLPVQRTAWWSMGFGLGALVLLVGASALPGADVAWGELNVVPSLALGLGLAALATGVWAHRLGERSVVLWIGLVPGALLGLLLIAELVFLE